MSWMQGELSVDEIVSVLQLVVEFELEYDASEQRWFTALGREHDGLPQRATTAQLAGWAQTQLTHY